MRRIIAFSDDCEAIDEETMPSLTRPLILALAPATALASPMLPASPPRPEVTAPEAAVAVAAPQPAPTQGGISVSAWRFSQTRPSGSAPPAEAQSASAGRPLYLWLTLDGGQAAIDKLRGGGKVAVQVRWTSESPAAHAPALTSSLDIGRPDLAATLQGEVAKTGHFQWHSWTRKDSLSPGHWTVSLTGPDGQPVACGAAPCQLSIDVS